MTVEVELGQTTSWKLIPPSTAEEIIQCVRCILATAKGTCWNYRDFGISTELIDKPLPVAKNKFLSEVVRAVGKYEKRARVKKISWVKSDVANGALKPVLTIEIP